MENELFENLLHRYEPMIKKQLKALNIYKNHDEFIQIGRIALWEACQRYDPKKGKFSTFAYVTIKGKLLEQLRKEHRFEERNQLVENVNQEEWGNEQTTEMLENEIFLSYLTHLSEKQKIWAIEAILHFKTPTNIAQEYDTTVEAVKSWRKEAIKKLRKHVAILSL